MKTHTILSLTIIMLLSSCNTNDGKLKIIVTTDVHGNIFGYDPSTGDKKAYSMSKVSSFVRGLNPDNLLILDNGDNLQGTPEVYYYNFEDTITDHLWPRVLDYIGYDAVTVGNHDIEAGHSVYDRISNYPGQVLLAANAIDISTGEPYFRPYKVIKKNGYKIVVFGLITPGVPGWIPEVLYRGLEFEDMTLCASRWMPEIEALKPDLVVGLFHAGWNEAYGGGNEGSYKNENASLSVARKVKGFDIVFIGHDHDLMNNFLINDFGDSVLVMDGSSSARYISMADITFSHLNDGRQKEIKGTQVKLDSIENDNLFDDFFKSDWENVSDYINRKIGDLGKAVSSRDAYFGDSEFMDIIHRVQLETSGADISFAAPLSFDVTLPEGEITVADMFELYRFENMLYTMELSGSEIDSYLEYTASLWFAEPREDNSVLKFSDSGGERLMNNYYNFDSAEGIIYSVNLDKAEGERVSIISMADGSSFYTDSLYTVALNSYRGSGGGGHLSRGCNLNRDEINSRIVSSTEKDLRYYMMKWIGEKGTLTVFKNNNWKIEGSEYLKDLMHRDYNRLFNEN